MESWTPALAFVGALIGSAGPTWSAWRGRRQVAGGEWRQRLEKAIDLLTSPLDMAVLIGDELLSDLIDSDLGSGADRALARRVADIRVRTRANRPDALDPPRGDVHTGNREDGDD